jgi:hypothetical protein
MAEALEEWPTRTRQQRYPWINGWTGRPWKLNRGSDFESKTMTFIANTRANARRRDGNVRTALFGEGTEQEYVVIQFRRVG